MNYKKLLPLSFIGLSLIITGCSSSDDDGAAGGTKNVGLPFDAITITTDNAEAVSVSALSSIDAADSLIGVNASLPPIQATIKAITDITFNRDRHASSIATGISDSSTCPGGGTYSDTWNETGNSEAGSASGSVTFTSCAIISTVTYNGNLTYSYTWAADGGYTDIANGTITITDTSSSESFTMTMDITETGNEFSGDYSIGMSYSVTGTSVGGFLAETSQNLTGTNFNDISSGQLIITGADSTRLRVTVTSTNTATYELDNGDGTFVMLGTITV